MVFTDSSIPVKATLESKYLIQCMDGGHDVKLLNSVGENVEYTSATTKITSATTSASASSATTATKPRCNRTGTTTNDQETVAQAGTSRSKTDPSSTTCSSTASENKSGSLTSSSGSSKDPSRPLFTTSGSSLAPHGSSLTQLGSSPTLKRRTAQHLGSRRDQNPFCINREVVVQRESGENGETEESSSVLVDRSPMKIVCSSGVHMFDETGRKFLDCVSGVSQDGETTALEDWFKAQGHSVHEPKITLRQRAINAYVELRWGLKYYDFPWKLKELFGACCIWGIGFIMFYLGLRQYLRDKMEALPDGDALKPQKIYLMWENDEIRDILHYYGIRKNKPSSQSRGGFYHMPKVEKKQKSEYTHTIYSNTRSGRLSKNKNREDHKKRLEDQKAKRLERINKLKQREYVEPSQKKEEAKEQLTVVSS